MLERVLRSRRLFVLLSRVMAPAIRRRWIRSSARAGNLCVLETRGRRSGRPREAALDYAAAPDGGIWVAAGWGLATQWYRNLLADPSVRVTIDGRARTGHAEPVTDPAARLAAMRAVLIASGAAGRAYGFDPERVDDETLETATRNVPVVHVRFA